MTKANNKYKVTIIALVVAMLALVGAVIGVWAASSQNLKVGFDISYDVGDGVAAEVRTEYRVAGGTVQTATKNASGQTIAGASGYVKFDSSDDGGEKLLDIGAISLTPQATYIEYFFTVHNIRDEGYVQAAFWIEFANRNNMLVDYYYCNKTKNQFNANESATSIAKSDWSMNQLDNASEEGYKFIKVVIEVGDTNAKAATAGTFNFMLNFDDRAQSVSTLDKSKFDQYTNFGGDRFTTNYKRGTSAYEMSTGDGKGIYMSGSEMFSQDTIVLPENSEALLTHYNAETGGPFLNQAVFNNIDTSQVKNLGRLLDAYGGSIIIEGIEKFDVSNVTSMPELFKGADQTFLDLTQWDTSKLEYVMELFSGASLKRIYVGSGWTMKSISEDEEAQSNLFYGCVNLRGAVAYDSNATDYTMANWETGYLTYKPLYGIWYTFPSDGEQDFDGTMKYVKHWYGHEDFENAVVDQNGNDERSTIKNAHYEEVSNSISFIWGDLHEVNAYSTGKIKNGAEVYRWNESETHYFEFMLGEADLYAYEYGYVDGTVIDVLNIYTLMPHSEEI